MGLNLSPTIKKPTEFLAVGLGIDFRAHMTPEAEQCLRRCQVIYALVPDSDVFHFLSSKFTHAKIVDCGKFYNSAKIRYDAYDKIVDNLIRELSEGKNVGLAIYGHPLFLVAASEAAIKRASALGYVVTVVPGISSFDTLQSDLRVDLGYGATLIDATLLLSLKIKIDTRLPLVIFQAANIGSGNVERASIPASRISPLAQYLAKSYPSDHPVVLVVSRKSTIDPPEIIRISIAKLDQGESVDLSSRPTIYIPEL